MGHYPSGPQAARCRSPRAKAYLLSSNTKSGSPISPPKMQSSMYLPFGKVTQPVPKPFALKSPGKEPPTSDWTRQYQGSETVSLACTVSQLVPFRATHGAASGTTVVSAVGKS